jgi:hypothetical protein
MTADLSKSNYHFWKKKSEAKWLGAEMHMSDLANPQISGPAA